MNRSVLIIVAAALLIAIIVAVSIQSRLAPKTPTTVEETPKTEILVANRDISIGDKIERSSVRWQIWPEEALFDNALEKGVDQESDFIGQIVRRSFSKDEPISEAAFVDIAEGGFLAAALGQDMRAFAVEVSADTSVGGFISPGDRVDVILTYQIKVRSDVEEETQEVVVRDASETILKNVKVLAIDQDTSSGEDREVKVGKTVTLEVTQSGAETLALAGEMGDLTLALRRLGEKDTQDKASELTTDVGIGKTLREVIMKRNAAVQSTNTIRIYGGGNVQDIQVRMPVDAGEEVIKVAPSRTDMQESLQ